MRQALVIATRELGAAFRRPHAYVVLGGFIALVSLLALWLDDVLVGGVASMRRPFFWMSLCLLFGVPALTMGTLSEERRSGHLHVLGSLPLPHPALILGKWSAVMGMVAMALTLTLPIPALIARYGALDPGPVVAGYLGLFLAAASLAAAGTAASAVVDSPASAYLLALEVGVIPWLVGWAIPLVPGGWATTLAYLSFEFHFDNLAAGVLDSRSLVFFGAATVWFLRVGTHALERRHLA